MKLTYVVQRYGREVIGGAEAACRQLARGMTTWADVTVLTTCALDLSWSNQLPAGEDFEDGVRILRFPTVSTRGPEFEKATRKVFYHPDPPRSLQERWMRAQGPECPALIQEIAEHAAEPDLWVFYTYLYYPTIFGLPLVASRSVLHPALHDEPPARLRIVRDVVRSAAGLSLQTHEEWELMIRLIGWPDAVTRLVGMGAENQPGDAGAFRAAHGLDSAPYVLCLGRVDRYKGTDELVKCFAYYKAQHPGPLKLVVAGPIVHRPPPHDDVIVTGPLSEEHRWGALEGCEALVHPSKYESFAIVLMEAWLKGKPAIVNRLCPATSGHARRARAGLPYADAVEFSASMQALMSDPAAAARLGSNGRAYADNYSWERVLKRYKAFLEEVAAAAGRRPAHGPLRRRP